MARRTRLGVSLIVSVLVVVPLFAIWLFLRFERACGSMKDGVGRYCSATQTWDWLRFDGGWWKMLLFAAVVAFAIWAQGKEEEAALQENRDARNSGSSR